MILYIFTTLNQTATTNIIEIRCQNIQWIVSKDGEPVSGIRIRILRMFSMKNSANPVMIAFVRVVGLISAVDRISRSSR